MFTSIKKPHYAILLGLLASALLISIPAFLSIQSNHQVGNSFHWVEHTLEVKGKTERLLALLVDSESGCRGYLLSNRENFLEPYHSALRQIPGQMSELKALTADNPVQQENLRQLKPLVLAKLERMAKNISLQRIGQSQEVQALILSNRGRELMDAIRAKLALIDAEETRLLSLRQESLRSNFTTNTSFLCGLIVLNGAFAGVMLLVYRRLRNVRNLVTVCAWSHKVQYENQWISFEEFLKRRFKIDCSHGISPEELEKMFGEVDAMPRV